MDQKFEPGDMVVPRNRTSPVMMVDMIEDGSILCFWFDEQSYRTKRFSVENLEKYVECEQDQTKHEEIELVPLTFSIV